MVDLQGVLFGAGLTAIGFLLFFFADIVTWAGEALDAVGSKRTASEVEPAEWNVGITAGIGALLALAGAVVFVLALIS